MDLMDKIPIVFMSMLNEIFLFWDKNNAPVTVAERSKACTVFARLETGIVGSNPTQGMDV